MEYYKGPQNLKFDVNCDFRFYILMDKLKFDQTSTNLIFYNDKKSLYFEVS